MEKFKELGLSEIMLAAIEAKGFTEPSPVQAAVIPTLMNDGGDIIAQAQTGTGKTAAFAIPLIEKLTPRTGKIQALVLAPTRELALQVATEIESLSGDKKLRVLTVYGGQAYGPQLKGLRDGVDIVVGTPGRVIDHLDRGSMELSSISYLIIDEADEMLNMGFAEAMEQILARANPDRRTLLFSATMPPRIADMARKFMKNSQHITVKKRDITTALIDQIYFEVKEKDKFEALCRIIDIEKQFYGLIFCRTKADVDQLVRKLLERNFVAEGLHGDVAQAQREIILDRFKAQKLTILVATDVAARGIDINNLSHVINYALPNDIDSYVHRIGRTGRAGNKGTAITFITPSEYRKLIFIQNKTRSEIRKAEVPDVKEVIKTKKARITEEIDAIVCMGDEEGRFTKWAEKLIEKYEARDLVAALLKQSFEEELDEQNYGEINVPERGGYRVDTRGTTRLFIAVGRVDGMNPRSLVDLIRTTSNIDDRLINDVKVLEKFSFVTVPFTEAESVIRSFSSGKQRLLVKKDRGPNTAPGSPRSGGFDDRPKRQASYKKKY